LSGASGFAIFRLMPQFIARIGSRWDVLLSYARLRWRLSWILRPSTVFPRYGIALRTWKKNARPLTVSKRDRGIRFIAAYRSGQAWLFWFPQSSLSTSLYLSRSSLRSCHRWRWSARSIGGIESGMDSSEGSSESTRTLFGSTKIWPGSGRDEHNPPGQRSRRESCPARRLQGAYGAI
jgi:hypothetical protein